MRKDGLGNKRNNFKLNNNKTNQKKLQFLKFQISKHLTIDSTYSKKQKSKEETILIIKEKNSKIGFNFIFGNKCFKFMKFFMKKNHYKI